jgi:16S rRNA (uracil1498-N3)-methyltransferase
VLPPVFYLQPSDSGSLWQQGDVVELSAEESRHAANVLRLRVGEIVILVDGLGTAYRAEAVDVSSRLFTARIHSVVRDFGEPIVRLTLAAGLSTGAKFDSVVQRGTELGVKRFVPLVTEKSKVVLDDPARARSRTNRLSKVALAAMKQCRRSYLPEIALPTLFSDFLREHDSGTLGVLFHCSGEAVSVDSLDLGSQTRRVTLVVGPESGFSGDEIALAKSAGFIQVSLGPRVLRTETAGPVVAALIMQRLGELR